MKCYLTRKMLFKNNSLYILAFFYFLVRYSVQLITYALCLKCFLKIYAKLSFSLRRRNIIIFYKAEDVNGFYKRRKCPGILYKTLHKTTF